MTSRPSIGRVRQPPSVSRALDAYVTGLCFDGTDTLAVALGDGTLRLAAAHGGDWRVVPIAQGSVLSLARDLGQSGFICGTDDGRFARVGSDGAIEDIACWPGKWVDHVARAGGAKDGLLACAAGRQLHLFGSDGRALKTLDHVSTVTGIAFDGKGRRIAAAHYNGASLWYCLSRTDHPRTLEWKGSHTGIAFHPAGEAVVTAMQDNALHGWRLADGQHMRMSGYPAKTESLDFSRGGKWLASSGADTIVLWPFFGGGPMGKEPVELGGGNGVLCTRVACNAAHDTCAAGFADGSVVIADLASRTVTTVAPPEQGPVTALAWSVDGAGLAFGTETGFAALLDFAAP